MISGNRQIYTPPTPAELRALTAAWELSTEDAGRILCINGRRYRDWLAGPSAIPWACLFLLACRMEARYTMFPHDWRSTLAGALERGNDILGYRTTA